MKIKMYLTLVALCLSALAFSQETNLMANAALQEELNTYHEELDLSGEQLYLVLQFLKEKMKKNEVVLSEIEMLKKQLDSIDLTTDKQIIGLLNEDQKVIMETKLKEKLAKQHEDFKAAATD